MNSRLGLFREMLKSFSRTKIQSAKRKLYTDSIYPYPHHYFDKKFPKQIRYRETFPDAPWDAMHHRRAMLIMRVFWTWFFYQLYHDPGVITGHFHPPDPSLYSDEELGIPPLEYGSYKDWLEQQATEESS